PQDPRQQLEQRRLAGAVGPDDADRFSGRDRQRDVAQRPELVPVEGIGALARKGARHERRDEVTKAVVALSPLVFLPDAAELDPAHQRFSAKSNSAAWNAAQATARNSAEKTNITAKSGPGSCPPIRTARKASTSGVIGFSARSAPRRPPTRPTG